MRQQTKPLAPEAGWLVVQVVAKRVPIVGSNINVPKDCQVNDPAR
jgi:hypothetical protein